MHNIRIELKKLRDTGEYSPNELKEITHKSQYQNSIFCRILFFSRQAIDKWKSCAYFAFSIANSQ